MTKQISFIALLLMLSACDQPPSSWEVHFGPRSHDFAFCSESVVAIADGKKYAEVKATKFTNETEGKYLIPKLYMEEKHCLGEDGISYKGILVYDTNMKEIIFEKAISGSKKAQFFPHGTCGDSGIPGLPFSGF